MKSRLEKPDWSEFWSLRLSNQRAIIDYIDWLEKEVKKMSQKLEASKREIMYSRRYNLTKIWDKDEEEE